MVDSVATTTAGLRKLGATEGGHEDALRLVHHHLIYVIRLLRQAKFANTAVANRLLAELGWLSGLAGWLAHDTGKHGLSQRYLTSGLRVAHTAGTARRGYPCCPV